LKKIKIIGDPGKQPVDAIKKCLKESLKKLNLSLKDIYLVFIENPQQLKKIAQKYLKGNENILLEISSEKEGLSRTEIYFAQIGTAAYLDNRLRKEGIPPIILIKKDVEISEETILDEVVHIAEEGEWNKIIVEALELIHRDNEGFWAIPIFDVHLRLAFFVTLSHRFIDHFSSEMLCQHGLVEEAFGTKLKMVNYWIKDCLPKKGKLEIFDFDLVTQAAFWSTLPPSYPRKKDEEKLEKIAIDYIRQTRMEPLYRKIKLIVSKLESPPKVVNIYKIGAEIIELAQDYLSK